MGKDQKGKEHCFMLRILSETEDWKRRQEGVFELQSEASKGQLIRQIFKICITFDYMDPSYEDTDKTGAQIASVGDKVSVSEDRTLFLLVKQHFKSN